MSKAITFQMMYLLLVSCPAFSEQGHEQWAMYIRDGKDMTLVVLDRDLVPTYFAARYGEKNRTLIITRQKSSDLAVTFDNSLILVQLDPAFINIYPTNSGHAVRVSRGNDLVDPFTVAPKEKSDAVAAREAAVFRVVDGFIYPASEREFDEFSLKIIEHECALGHGSLRADLP